MSNTVPLYGFGGGGATLNFKVVGGSSAPENPGKNTIWVNTSTAITNWIFSRSAPEIPSAGMVWIHSGAASSAEFNALKKNGIMISPISVKQYVSGAWENRTAKIYQDGAWIDFVKWLYNNGTWGNGTALTKGYTYGSPTVTYNENFIRVICGSDNITQYLYFPQMENLEGRSKIVFKFRSNAAYTTNYSEDWGAGVRIGVSASTDHKSLAAQAKQYNLSSGTTYTLELDLPNLPGYYYIHLMFARGDSNTSGSVNVDILEVYLA